MHQRWYTIAIIYQKIYKFCVLYIVRFKTALRFAKSSQSRQGETLPCLTVAGEITRPRKKGVVARQVLLGSDSHSRIPGCTHDPPRVFLGS